MFDDKFSKKKSLLLAQCHMYDASLCITMHNVHTTNTIRFTIMYAHVYRYIYVHIARTHERLALQWHTIYSEEKWAKYFKNEKRSKKRRVFDCKYRKVGKERVLMVGATYESRVKRKDSDSGNERTHSESFHKFYDR